MVVEDTGPDIIKECGMFMGNEGAYVQMGPKQLQCFRQFLRDQ